VQPVKCWTINFDVDIESRLSIGKLHRVFIGVVVEKDDQEVVQFQEVNFQRRRLVFNLINLVKQIKNIFTYVRCR